MLPFVDDLSPKNFLTAAVYRAPVGPARVRRLELPQLPAGTFAVRARQVPGARVLCCGGYCLPVLADTRVLYPGEPLVLFCGPDREEVGELLRAVVLECEPEEVDKDPPGGPPAVSLSRGDAQAAFAGAEQIVEGQYLTPASSHLYPDPQGAVAQWAGRTLTLYSACEDPFAVRREVARALDLPERRVRVLATRLADTMQGKLLPAVLVAAQAALLALSSGASVKLVLDRREDLLSTPRSPAFLIRHQTALGTDGAPTGARVEITMSTGPLAPAGPEVLEEAARAAWGAYRLPSLEVTARWAPAGGPPGGSFRAAGAGPACFAAELHASRLEEIAQLDPYTWKKRWLPESERAPGPPEGAAQAGRAARGDRANVNRNRAIHEVFEEVVQASDFRRKHAAYAAARKRRSSLEGGPLRGVGLAVAPAEPEREPLEPGRGPAALRVVLEKGRRLRVYSSLVESAAGVQRILAERAAELLQLDTGKVEFMRADTQLVPDTGPTSLDRALRVALPLLEQCCQAVGRKALRESLPVEARRTARSQPRRPREGRAWAAAVAEVELDPITLESQCRGLWLAVSAGSLLCEEQARRTLEGQSAQALVLASQGLPAAPGPPSGEDCLLLPGPPSVGQLEIRLLPGTGVPLDYERLPHLCVPAAYTAAVSQASGLYIDEIPVTAEGIEAWLHHL